MNSHHKLEQQLEALGRAISTDETLVEQVMNQAQTTEQPTRRQIHVAIGRLIMNRPLIKLSVAAMVVMAMMVAMHFGRDTSMAWSQVLDNVSGFDTYRFRLREVRTTGPRDDGFEFSTETESVNTIDEQFGALHETYKNGTLYWQSCTQFQDQTHLFIDYAGESYMHKTLSQDEIQDAMESHPKSKITKLLQGQYRALGSTTIDGKQVQGIEIRDPNAFHMSGAPIEEFVATLWIEPETHLPVWAEISFKPLNDQMVITAVVDRFEWGIQVDPNLFELDIPAGFRAHDVEVEERTQSPEPATEAVKAFKEDTRNNPYLAEFDHLARPDVNDLVLLGIEPVRLPVETRLSEFKEICQAQDDNMRQWPAYDEVYNELVQDLRDTMYIDQLTVEELVALGISLREQFWKLNGCLSPISYPYAYSARIVTELAHEKAPEDTAVIDQFIESVITFELIYQYQPDSDEKTVSPLYGQLVLDLRVLQFEKIKQQVSEGQGPTWRDFVRIYDLAMLLGSRAKDYTPATAVTQWMIQQAPTAGWIYYLDILNKMDKAYNASQGLGANIFVGRGAHTFPEDFRFSRRSFSYQGPKKRQQKLMPIHMLQGNVIFTND